MEAKECRKVAREALAGNWGFGVALCLLFMVVVLACGYIPFIGSLAWLVLATPFNYVFEQFFLQIKRGSRPDIGEFFTRPFNLFTKCWSTYFRVILKLLPYLIMAAVGGAGVSLTTIGGIMSDGQIGTAISVVVFLSSLISVVGCVLIITNSFYYTIVQFLILDNPTMSGKEIVEKSKMMMKGNRLDYFYLQLTFIGWSVLAYFTCGLGYLWLTPYMTTASAAFYEGLIAEENEEDVDAVIY